MKKREIIMFALSLVLVAAAGGGVFYYSTQKATAEAAASTEAAMQTAVASRGDLTISATGAGQVIASTTLSIGFDEVGTLTELNVAMGQTVKKGDVLARMQTSKTEEEIQLEISDAEVAVLQTQQTVDDLYANAQIARTTALNDIATYSQAVRDAQYDLENWTVPAFMQNMTAMEALDQTRADLQASADAFNPYRYAAQADPTRRSLLEAFNIAQSNYDAAVKRLNYENVLEVAEANLDKARAEYDQYANGPAADELTLAQAQLDNAQARLAQAKEEKSVEDLIAPIDGTVMSVSGTVGEVISEATIITLANLTKVVVEVWVDETDLDKVAIGYPVEAAFDAFPDLKLTGKITNVDPSLQQVSGVYAIRAVAELDMTGQSVKLPVGSNGTVDVIAGQAANAVLIPLEALRDLGDGEFAVFVVENGEPVLRPVTVGLKDITFAEITSGLEAGETVSTGVQTTE